MSFSSPFPQVHVPTTSLHEYLFADLDDADAERIALVDAKTGVETTYREMISRVDAFAGALAARGVGVGDVVGLLDAAGAEQAAANVQNQIHLRFAIQLRQQGFQARDLRRIGVDTRSYTGHRRPPDCRVADRP